MLTFSSLQRYRVVPKDGLAEESAVTRLRRRARTGHLQEDEVKYFFSSFKANVQPFLFRGNNRNDAPGQLQVRLPNLFTQQQSGVQQGPFSLVPRSGDSTFP